MDKLNIYYVLVDFDNPQDRQFTAVRSRMNLVIADSEDTAIAIMNSHIHPYSAQVYIPEFASAEAAQAVGHGADVTEFLTDPASKVDYRTLVDLYRDKYNNYYGQLTEADRDINILLWDESGQVKVLNDYIHGTYKKKEPEGSLINNNFVIIRPEDTDAFSGGIAFVGTKEATEDNSIVSLGNSILMAESTYFTTEEGVQLTDNLQVKLTVHGEILVRNLQEDGTYSDWKLSPIFTEEAPVDGNSYVRTNASWKALEYDSVPTSGSENLVTSHSIKNYVDNAVIRVYRYQGSRTVEEMSSITDVAVGDVYNMKDSGIIVTNEISTEVHVGDNIAWDGEKWDNLNGIFELNEYVKFTNYATATTAGVVKIDGQNGLYVDESGKVSITFASPQAIEDKEDNNASIAASTVDFAIYKSTHQSMSDTYDTSELNVSDLMANKQGKLPVSYDAVKAYIDSKDYNDSPEISTQYQTVIDESFSTTAKSVSGAINELNDKVDIIYQSLSAGWNVVKLNKLYPVSWTFTGKPFCYTADGHTIDFRIRNISNYIVDGVHAFEMYVSEECELRCSVTSYNIVDGVPADYMVISYYYTGNDGDDLDTVTTATGASLVGTAGYGYSQSVTDENGVILAKWAGDNIGGGASFANVKFYEEVILDLNAIRNYDDHDLRVAIYAAWYASKLKGNIHVEVTCYQGSIDLNNISIGNDKRFRVSSLGAPTYQNPTELVCNVPAFLNQDKTACHNFTSTYTEAFSVDIHHTTASGNACSFTINRLA